MHVFESLLKPSKNDQNNPISPYLLLTKFRESDFGQQDQFKLSSLNKVVKPRFDQESMSRIPNFILKIRNSERILHQILLKDKRVEFNMDDSFNSKTIL